MASANRKPLDLRDRDAIDLGYGIDFHILLRAIDEAMPKDAILALEGDATAPAVAGASCANTRPPSPRELVANASGKVVVHHLPLADDNLAQLRMLAEDCASPEVAFHLAVYRDDEVLLWAHDAGDGSLRVAKSLPTETVERFRAALGDDAQAAPRATASSGYSARATSSCQRRIVASGGSAAAASRSKRSAAAVTCSGGRRWIVERCRARNCSAARSRETEPGCSNQRRRTSAKPASASSRHQHLGRGEAGEIDRGQVGQVGPQVVTREVVRCEGPHEQAALGGEHAPRLGQGTLPAVAQRMDDEAHRHRVEPALAEGQVVGLRELEGGPAHAPLARLREHLLRGVDAPRLHAQALDRGLDQRARAAADVEQARGRAEPFRDGELELLGELVLRTSQIVVARGHAIEDRRRRAVVGACVSNRRRRLPRP